MQRYVGTVYIWQASENHISLVIMSYNACVLRDYVASVETCYTSCVYNDHRSLLQMLGVSTTGTFVASNLHTSDIRQYSGWQTHPLSSSSRASHLMQYSTQCVSWILSRFCSVKLDKVKMSGLRKQIHQYVGIWYCKRLFSLPLQRGKK